MPILPSVFLTDRRLWLLGLTTLLAVIVSFYTIPDRWVVRLVSATGFWFVLVAFVVWLVALWRTFGADVKALRPRNIDWPSVLVVLVGGVVLLVHESYGFKIVLDELMLLGTSMSMHLDKSAITPHRGNDIQGAFVILQGMVDKRPLFFPFLVSLLHDLLGYRPANAFVLNTGLTFAFLGLVCQLGRLLAGRLAGWLAVILFAGLPLLAHNSTGGGFELLNLTMIVATLLVGIRWVERRDGASLTAFCFTGALLAQVRYESAIYLIPVALLVLFVWLREQRPILTWPVIFLPLLMVHYPLQNRLFTIDTSFWQMASKADVTEPFSVAYIPNNLAHALGFFFGRASDQPNSIVLSALGVLAIPFFALVLIKQTRRLASLSPTSAVVMAFSVGFVLQFLLFMCYFWGTFDDVVIRRLSLPTHLAMVMALLAILPQFKNPLVMRTLLGAAAVGLLSRSVPSMAAHAYSQEYLPGREVAWRREFMAAQPQPDYLMIDNDSVLWVTHRVSATPTTTAVKRREDIAFHMRNRTFSDVYVFQRITVDPETGEHTLRKDDDLGPEFVLEPVVEQRLKLLTISRISRVKEIKSGNVSVTTPPPVGRAPDKPRTEIEAARKRFSENYIKQLP